MKKKEMYYGGARYFRGSYLILKWFFDDQNFNKHF